MESTSEDQSRDEEACFNFGKSVSQSLARIMAREGVTYSKIEELYLKDRSLETFSKSMDGMLTLFRPGFFFSSQDGEGGGGGFGGPTPVTLQPLMVWLPNFHRTIYSLLLSSRYSLFVTMT